MGTNVAGSFGSISIAANGAYTYTVNNSLAAVQALRTTGNTLTDVFTYTLQNSEGTATTQITVTIQGANDAPTVSQVTGAVAAYDFENGSGNAPSTVAGGPTMTIGSGVTYTTSAGRFSGSNGLLFSNAANSSTRPVTLAPIPNVAASNAFSFGAWVRYDFTDNMGRIFDFGGGEHISNFNLSRSGTSNSLALYSTNAAGTATGQLTVSNVIHQRNMDACRRDRRLCQSRNAVCQRCFRRQLYRDFGDELCRLDEPLHRRVKLGSDMQFRGAMDDIAIFDRALSVGEVSALASTVTQPTIVNKSIAENSPTAPTSSTRARAMSTRVTE